MTLKTVTGPSIRAALADARRIFGGDVLLLESMPQAGDDPACVTIAFDAEPVSETPPAPRRKALKHTKPVEERAPHWTDIVSEDAAPKTTYGYAASTKRRKIAPVAPEPISAPTPIADPAVEALLKRIANLEAAMARRPQTAEPTPTIVFVGPAGAGKTSMALRIAQQPHLAGARSPAVLLYRPEEQGPDPTALFWASGIPVAIIRDAAEATAAVQDFADADAIIVDTPSLSLRPDVARLQIARLAAILAPLAPLDVHFVLDACRSAGTIGAKTLYELGIRPDALALSRLDEAVETAGSDWMTALELPLRFTSAGPNADDLSIADPSASAPPAHGYSKTVASLDLV